MQLLAGGFRLPARFVPCAQAAGFPSGPWRAKSNVKFVSSSPEGCLVQVYKERAASGVFKYNEGQLPCLERLESLRREMMQAGGKMSSRTSAPRGVYVYGDPGGGKTMMMDMFHDAVKGSGLPSRRAHFHDFMLDMNRELHRIRKQVGGVKDPLALVAKSFVAESPLLCFDECHVINVGDALLMRAFFERLFEAGGTVVATSNLAPDELYSSGINREVFQPFIDAIMSHCDPVRLTVGEDFRSSKSAELKAADGERTFFWPLGVDADVRLQETLRVVLGRDEEPQPCEITVPMGRTLKCRRAWRDGEVQAAEFSYNEICVAAVGTYDYLALCEEFDAIVITGVPNFSTADENAARRFAAFVDILYDRHKRLLCTIDAPPNQIFQAIREQYSGGVDDDSLQASVRMPTHGGSSGKHVAQFRLPQAVKYTDSGGYAVDANGQVASETPAIATISEDHGWVEWSATGLKDASMFDLTCNTKQQQYDRLLPLIRCESRLEEMSYLHGQAMQP